jgi:MFS family permease
VRVGSPVRSAAEGSARPARRTTALLRDRTLARFLAGNLTSNVGTWMHNIAAAIVVYDLTGSALLVGLLMLAQFGPTMVLAPWAGAVADRVDRRRLLVASLVLAGSSGAALAAWVALVGVEGLPGTGPVFAASAVIGIGHAFAMPALHSVIPSLVPREDLDRTLALTTVTFNVARTVGPAIAGLVLASLGAGAAFALNSASFLVFALMIIATRVPRRATSERQPGSVRDGLRFVRQDSLLVVLLIGVASLGFAQDPVNTLGPAIAHELGGGDALFGALVGSFGLGSIIAVVLGGPIRAAVRKSSAAAGGLVTLGAGMGLLAAAPVPALAIGSLLIAGLGFLFAITALMGGIYSRVPDDLRGRVLALWGVAFLGSRPLAGVVDGAVADLVSPRVAIAFSASVAIGAAVLVRTVWAKQSGPDRDVVPLAIRAW